MVIRLLLWALSLSTLGWLTFPLTYRLFNKLPDRGFGLSRIFGLLLWGFIFWLGGVLNLLQNTPGGILFALSVLLFFSLLAGWGRWREIWDWVRQHRRLIMVMEGVFLAGFAFMVLVRAADPSATGTEKPMELAFINAIMRSESFPPNDPWLSGYAISYYHFGYILTAMLAKVTATSGSVAFNLMLAAVFGMSALGAYSILYNMLAVFGLKAQEAAKKIAWALLGPLFLLFISNLEGVLEVLHAAGVGWNGASSSAFWRWVNIESLLTAPAQPTSLVPQRFWWWWQSSRVIHDIDLLGNVSGLSPIDEFPAFSFVLGDLHPHVLVMPFVMLLVGLALTVYLGGLDGKIKVFGLTLPYRFDLFAISAITLGGIAFLNTWDLPVYFALLVGAYLMRRVMSHGWSLERVIEALKLALPLGVFSVLLYAPFFISFQSQAGGILPNLIYPTRGFYLWLMFGTLFIPIFFLFGWLLRRKYPAVWGWGSVVVLALVALLALLSVLMGYQISKMDIGQQVIASQGERSYGSLLLSATLHRLGFGVTLLTLAGLLIAGAAFLFGKLSKQSGEGEQADILPFVLLMIVLGGMMVLAPEFVYLRDNFGARMNTVFKFYYQAWMLWSLAAAFSSVVLLTRGRWFSKIVVMIFILLGLVYPVLAYPTRTDGFKYPQGFSLDASAYLAQSQPNEAAAIDWLSQAPVGVVAEAVGGQYSGYARVSTLSGQPAVLGWPGHEGQWRGGYTEVGSREPDMRTLYETPDWETALEIIQRYDITYIYVGGLERSTYALNADKFNQNLAAGFEQGGVVVYVVPETLQQ